MLNPDVTFSQTGDITVMVQGQNIPDGTPVRLRATMVGNVIDKPAAGEAARAPERGHSHLHAHRPARAGNDSGVCGIHGAVSGELREETVNH